MGLWSIFATVLLAELGDKTQVATLLFVADPRLSRLGVFVASAGALAFSSLLAVFVGGQLSNVLSPRLLKGIAGAGFVWPVDPPGPTCWLIGLSGCSKLLPRVGQALQCFRWEPTLGLRGQGLLQVFEARKARQGGGEIGFAPGEA